MKNTIKILLLTFVIFACGCAKYLDLDPLNKANGEQVWGNANGCRQLLSGTYGIFRKTLLSDRPFFVYGDLPSQTVLKPNDWAWKEVTEGKFAGVFSEPSWGKNWADWSPFYKVIDAANTLSEHVGDVPDKEFNRDEATGNKEKRSIKAQADFLYAYANFYLTRIWGSVPLVKEAFESADQALQDGSTVGRKQSSEKEVLEYTLTRLNSAISNLDYNTPGDNAWAVTADKAAAQVLKAHICLWLANSSYKGEARERELFVMAQTSLDSAISYGNRSLVDYSDEGAVNDMFKGKSSEGIFELNISVEQSESFWMNDDNFNIVHNHTYWRESFEGKSSPQYTAVVDKDWAPVLYPENDVRRTLFFESFGNANDDKKNPGVLKKYAAGMQEDPLNTGRFFAEANVPLLRLTDAVLLHAETWCKLGEYGKARIILNQIRNRSGIGDFEGGDGELLAGIFEERARELVGEGQSYFDRVRNDYWVGCDFMPANRLSRGGNHWPVAMSTLFSSNRELVQVSWWSGTVI